MFNLGTGPIGLVQIWFHKEPYRFIDPGKPSSIPKLRVELIYSTHKSNWPGWFYIKTIFNRCRLFSNKILGLLTTTKLEETKKEKKRKETIIHFN